MAKKSHYNGPPHNMKEKTENWRNKPVGSGPTETKNKKNWKNREKNSMWHQKKINTEFCFRQKSLFSIFEVKLEKKIVEILSATKKIYTEFFLLRQKSLFFLDFWAKTREEKKLLWNLKIFTKNVIFGRCDPLKMTINGQNCPKKDFSHHI